MDFKLVASEQQLIKWIASPRLKTFFPYNKDLAGLNLKKQTIVLNRPVYVGLTVLDISKLVMYNFHYNWAIKKYGDNVKLCMTDTDSFFYSIHTDDVYEDMKRDLHLFDTSNYQPDHPNYSSHNHLVLGKFKDESNGKPPKEIIGLRAKCYSMLQEDNKEKKVAKGVPRVAIRKHLQHQLYRSCLFKHQSTFTSSLCIRSRKHQIFTQQLSKLSLSPYDDKRYILPDGIETLAYGHYQIPEEEGPSPAKRRRSDEAASTSATSDVPSDLLELAALIEREEAEEDL